MSARYRYRKWSEFAIGETIEGVLVFPPKRSRNGEFYLSEIEHDDGRRTGFCIVAALEQIKDLHVGTRIRIKVRGKKITGTGFAMWDLGLLIL